MIALFHKFNITDSTASLKREIRHAQKGNRFHVFYSVIKIFTHLEHTIPHFIFIYNTNNVYISEQN